MKVLYCNSTSNSTSNSNSTSTSNSNSNSSSNDSLIDSINNDIQSLLSISNEDENINNVYDFMIVDNITLMSLLLPYCEGLDDSDNMIIIIDINNNTQLIEDIGQLLRLSIINRRPRFILLSTLLTWDGNSRSNDIVSYTNEFLKRVPNAS